MPATPHPLVPRGRQKLQFIEQMKPFDRRLAGAAIIMIGGVAALIFWGLGREGLWQPTEASLLAIKEWSAAPSSLLDSWLNRRLILAMQPWALYSDCAARLPFAICALGCLAVCLTVSMRHLTTRSAWFAILCALTSPILLLNARSVASLAPAMVAQALFGWTLYESVVIWRDTQHVATDRHFWRVGLAWCVAALASGSLAVLGAGVLQGLLPAMVALTLTQWTHSTKPTTAMSGWGARLAWRAPNIILTLASLGAAAATLWTVFRHQASFNVWVGAPLQHAEPAVYSDALVRLSHGLAWWFPFFVLGWSQAIMGPAQESAIVDDAQASQRPPSPLLRYLALWCASSLAAQTLFSANYGQSVFIALVPAACLVGHWYAERQASVSLATWIVVALLMLLPIRDMFLFPLSPLHALAINAPTVTMRVESAWMLSLGAFTLAFGFFARTFNFVNRHERWARVTRIVSVSGTVLAAMFVVFRWSSALGAELSSKKQYEQFLSLRNNQEPLGHYRVQTMLAERYVKHAWRGLDNIDQVASFLDVTEKRWVLAPREEVGALDNAFYHRHKTHLFAPSWPEAGNLLLGNTAVKTLRNLNPIASAVRSSAPQLAHPMDIQFEQGVHLLDAEFIGHPKVVRRHRDVTLRLVFRVDHALSQDWRIFVHFEHQEQPDFRVLGDHDPVHAAYPTRFWQPGQIIVDDFVMHIPRTKRGAYNLYLGLFIGDTRMPIKVGPQDKEKRALAGRFTVK